MKTNTYVHKKHPEMVNVCNRTCLACSKIWLQVTAIKQWLIYDVHNFYSFWISPACLWAWSRRHLDCNSHRKPICVGYAWRVFWNRSHTWQQTALRQNWQQLSLKRCFAETNSVMTQHKGMQEWTETSGARKYLREGGGGGGSVLPFLLK